MSALKHLAALPIARQSIVDAGGLDGLVELATSPSMDQGAKDAAALVLAALAAPPHTELVAASGGDVRVRVRLTLSQTLSLTLALTLTRWRCSATATRCASPAPPSTT